MNIENVPDCLVEGNVVRQVDKFKYLGTYLAKDGTLTSELVKRLKKRVQAMGMLKNV